MCVYFLKIIVQENVENENNQPKSHQPETFNILKQIFYIIIFFDLWLFCMCLCFKVFCHII